MHTPSQAAVSLLKQRFPANTWFAVYKIDRSMRMLQPFTSDPARSTTSRPTRPTRSGPRRPTPRTRE